MYIPVKLILNTVMKQSVSWLINQYSFQDNKTLDQRLISPSNFFDLHIFAKFPTKAKCPWYRFFHTFSVNKKFSPAPLITQFDNTLPNFNTCHTSFYLFNSLKMHTLICLPIVSSSSFLSIGEHMFSWPIGIIKKIILVYHSFKNNCCPHSQMVIFCTKHQFRYTSHEAISITITPNRCYVWECIRPVLMCSN